MKDRRTGVALLEFAAMALILTPVIVGGIQMAECYYLTYVLQDAVADAAKFAAYQPYDDARVFERAVQDRALATARLPALRREQVQVRVVPGPNGPASVTVGIAGFALPTPGSATILNGKPNATFPYLRR